MGKKRMSADLTTQLNQSFDEKANFFVLPYGDNYKLIAPDTLF